MLSPKSWCAVTNVILIVRAISPWLLADTGSSSGDMNIVVLLTSKLMVLMIGWVSGYAVVPMPFTGMDVSMIGISSRYASLAL